MQWRTGFRAGYGAVTVSSPRSVCGWSVARDPQLFWGAPLISHPGQHLPVGQWEKTTTIMRLHQSTYISNVQNTRRVGKRKGSFVRWWVAVFNLCFGTQVKMLPKNIIEGYLWCKNKSFSCSHSVMWNCIPDVFWIYGMTGKGFIALTGLAFWLKRDYLLLNGGQWFYLQSQWFKIYVLHCNDPKLCKQVCKMELRGNDSVCTTWAWFSICLSD